MHQGLRRVAAESVRWARVTRGVVRLLRTAPATDPEGLIHRQFRNRETVFLETARRAVFGNPGNPYAKMFELAGCAFEDLAAAVKRDGLERTLAELLGAGVYLTHDELKGKTPIVRSGRHIASCETSFANPLVSAAAESRSGGSRSRGTRVPMSLEYQIYREAYWALIGREFGMGTRAEIYVWQILPTMTGLTSCLIAARLGHRLEAWFSAGSNALGALHYRTLTGLLVALSRLLGARIPSPSYLPPNDFAPVAERIAGLRARGVPCLVGSAVSPASRIAAAALDKGLDIRGTLFMVSGEALTDAKRKVIESAGAEVCPYYWVTELGPVGFGCRRGGAGGGVHVFQDAIAVISRRRRAPLADMEVDSLLFTSLLPCAPLVLINAEMDDSGIIAEEPCDCAFGKAGFRRRIREIASYGKLTGMGMTLVGSDVVRILEERLPARLGGRPGDYQLVEQECGNQTRLTLRVSPRVGMNTPAAARDCFLEEMRRYEGGAPAVRNLRHARGMEAVIAEPYATRAGKVLPLHLIGASTGHDHET